MQHTVGSWEGLAARLRQVGQCPGFLAYDPSLPMGQILLLKCEFQKSAEPGDSWRLAFRNKHKYMIFKLFNIFDHPNCDSHSLMQTSEGLHLENDFK